MRTDPNAHVTAFLKYYLRPENELDYAVLLAGRWGSGKTHLVRRFLEESSAKHFFVSLNGVNSVRQIEEEFFRQRHPILASKGMRVTGAILRGAIKATLKVDLNADAKEDGSVTAQLPAIDMVKELGNPKDYVLVFDDLERCSMRVPDVLGYINAFVEQDAMKVIVLANDEELDKADAAYKRIKEKLFGQTLRVSPNAEAAFDRFANEISDQRVKEFLIAQDALIVALHRESGTDNLRLLKHAIWDFARVAPALQDRHWSKENAVVDLLKIIVALSFEARSGRVNRSEMPKMVGMNYLRYFERHESDTKTLEQEVEERYPDVSFEQVILDGDMLQRLLFDGWVEPDAITAALDSSPTFGDRDSVPAWRRGWESFDLPDDEFASLVDELEEEFSSRKIEEAGPMMHLFGIRLHLAEIRAISRTKQEVVQESKHYLDDLLKNGRAPNLLEGQLDTSGFGGLGFQERKTKEFRAIASHLSTVAETATKRLLPTLGKELLARLDSEPEQFVLELVHNNVRRPRFARLPVLADIDPQAFVDKVLSIQPSAQRTAFRTLKERYQMGALQSELKRELPWLRKVRALLRVAADSAQPNTKARLKSMIKHVVDPMIATVPPKPRKLRSAPK